LQESDVPGELWRSTGLAHSSPPHPRRKKAAPTRDELEQLRLGPKLDAISDASADGQAANCLFYEQARQESNLQPPVLERTPSNTGVGTTPRHVEVFAHNVPSTPVVSLSITATLMDASLLRTSCRDSRCGPTCSGQVGEPHPPMRMATVTPIIVFMKTSNPAWAPDSNSNGHW